MTTRYRILGGTGTEVSVHCLGASAQRPRAPRKIRAFGCSTFPAEDIVEAHYVAERHGLQRFRTRPAVPGPGSATSHVPDGVWTTGPASGPL